MTVRQTPSGAKLKDGYRSLVTFDADPDVSLFEMSVKPPGLDGGDKVDNTTFWNDTVRTYAARQLKEMTDGSMTCGYDPKVYTQLLALINVETLVTVLFSDSSRIEFYGFLKNAEPNELKEGEFPTLSCTICCTNTHPTTGAEVVPVYYPSGSADT